MDTSFVNKVLLTIVIASANLMFAGNTTAMVTFKVKAMIKAVQIAVTFYTDQTKIVYTSTIGTTIGIIVTGNGSRSQNDGRQTQDDEGSHCRSYLVIGNCDQLL